MEGNDHDNRPGSDRQYREGLMTGLLIALASWAGMVDGHHHRHTGVAWSEPQARPLTCQRNSRNPYGFRPLVFNQGTISRQKNQAAFLRPRRFMVPAVALATSKITVLLSG